MSAGSSRGITTSRINPALPLWKPEMLLAHATRDEALVHLFDEPQLNTQDGYIGFMLFFDQLRRRDRLLFVCLHPQEPWQVELLREIAESLFC